MIHLIRRSAIFCASVLFTFSLPVAHMMPTAFAAPSNPSINADGQWFRSGPGFVANATTGSGDDLYIIGHQAPSLARYRGDIPGLAPTSPEATGAARLDTDAPASQAYLAYLAGLHANLKASIEAQLGRTVEVAYRYDAVFNGIAVRMNPAEAQEISTLAGIRSVTRDYSRQLTTDNGPHWIGADVIWGEGDAELPSGAAACEGNCGEGVVTGIIDTGVNFDHPSFADIGGDGYDHTNPRGIFYGACDPVTGAPFCNDKLIGFWDFTGTSPIDDNGHGSHTASTTAGNVLNITLQGNTIDLDRSISGVAPHANIISYKGCSGTPVGCLISALLGSINQATLDEVDVINYSIGGSSSNPWADLDAQAFFDAYEAGIFVATSASNDGPGFGTLGSPADAPWVTSVGASTHDRKLANGVVNMTGGSSTPPADIFGKGITSGAGPAPIVYAGDFPSTETATPELCGAGTGDPATGEGTGGSPWTGQGNIFEGMIVLCDRGEYGRVAKGGYVAEHGAIGYILTNDAANGDSLVADNHVLPGVHITHADGNVLKAWLADDGVPQDQNHIGSIAGLAPGQDAQAADVMASFSSRGANPAAPSLIKPDVTAPGVDILAAWMADPAVTAQDILLQGSDGEQYNIISGTSMSSPHTAGSGALIRAVHPLWSPDEVKSALMTTAFTTMANGNNGSEVHGVLKEDAATPADPFDMGAGRVDLHVAANAGFVLDETALNYETANPGAGGDVTTLNIASLGNDNCGTFSVDGTCSWTRTLKGTAPGPVSWSVSSSGEANMVISASPSFFTLNPGQSVEIEFTADVSASPKNEWIFGEVRFTPSGSVPEAHFPVAVIPKPPGGGTGGVDLYMHGNVHDDCVTSPTMKYQADGSVDVANGCTPFLSEDPLDTAPAARWELTPPILNGTAVDPHWVWYLNGDDTQIAGNMLVSWWASQAITDPINLFDTNFDITVTVDGNPHVVNHRVGHFFTTPGQPQRLSSVVPVPLITASDTVEVKIDPVFIDTGNTVTFYYDSSGPCLPGGSGSCNSLVSIPVIDEPLAPVALDDFVNISSGETVAIDVLANDFDPEGGPLAVQIVSGPSSGNAELTASNTIIYTHDGSASVSDSIVYRITDNDGLTAEATVHIAIAGACTPAPDYLDEFETGAPGWTVDTFVLVDPLSNTWDLRADTAAQSPMTAFNTDAIAQDPVTNADTTKDVRLVSPEFLVSGGTVLSFWHYFNTEDTFDGGVLEISVDGGAWQDIIAAGGTFIQGGYNSLIGALGSRPGWSGMSPGFPASMNQVQVSLAPFNGETIQVRFRLAQDVLLGTGAPVGWSIDNVELNNLYSDCGGTTDNPPVARDDSDDVMADGMVTTIVKANDSDPDNTDGDLSGHTVEVITAPQHGTTMVDVMSGDVTYDHNDGNTANSDWYEYKLTDPEGNFDTAMVTITIDHGNNAAPEAADDTGTVNAGESVTVDVLANDSDANHSNEELTVTIETSPSSGVAAVNSDGSITYSHSGDLATSDSFQYRVTDPLGASDVATVFITINQDTAEECRNDLCAGGEDPAELTFTFVGGTCADSANSQDGKDDCTDHNPAGASGNVVIKVTNKEDADYGNADVYFYGAVSEGEDFTFSSDLGDSSSHDDDFGSKIFLHIYDADGNTLLQTIEVHTSCSAPLVEGDQFGSVRLGDASVDPEAQMCSTGEGRVHGSGYWDRGTGEKHDKIDFSFDAKVYKGGYKGKLKIHDKDIDLKIDAKTITSLSTGTGQMCDNYEMDGVATFAFTAVGKWEFGDEVIENAEFYACGEDNGKNNEAPLDNLYVECVQSCGYNTAVRIMDDSNDIAGGNIHLHDAIVDPVASGSPSAMTASSGDSSTQSQPESGSSRASSTESGTASSTGSETPGTSDTVTLEPILLSRVPAGTPMVITAIVEMHGGVIDGTPVTLHWTTGAGLEGQTAAVVNSLGLAAFTVTVPAGDVDYTARAGDIESNGMRLTGF